MDGKTHDSLIATGFLRAGPRVLFREKDNPERRFDYLDDMLGTIGKGTLGLTVNCARCHNHKFDPIAQKDYYALEASIFGYVETEVPLAPQAEAEAYLAKNEEIDAQARRAQAARSNAIEKPYRDRLERRTDQEQVSGERSSRRRLKPEAERTPGEQLLATQVFKAVSVSGAAGRQGPDAPRTVLEKKELTGADRRPEKQRPAPLPMAEIATDGDYRFSPLGEGDETVSCPKCRIPAAGPGTLFCTRVRDGTRCRRRIS